jgi:diacylglycerol kinase family enzyme
VLAGSGKALGVLPLGTLNLLARDLGVPAPLELALAALARGRVVSIDLARLNGRMFHTLSGVGFFSHMAKAREETRGLWAGRLLSVGLAAVRALRHSQPLMLELDIDGRVEKIEAYAALVTSNRFGTDWRRLRLDEGVLEVHVAEHRNALSRIGHGAALLSGSWRSNPGLHSFTARKISIAHARTRHFVATDGERRRERAPLRYDIAPKALKVITPVHEAIQPVLAAGATPS